MDNNYFNQLYQLDVNDRVEKKNGLTYLSWAYAWAETKKLFPDALYDILKFEGHKPYVFDELTGYMVFTTVTIKDVTHEMWLPVMDGANKAMKHEQYTYQVKEYKDGKPTGNYTKKSVEAASMFDINKTIMRCLVKNLAMHGLGLYIYAGEDIPENEEGNFVKPPMTKETAAKVVLGFGKNKGSTLGDLMENDLSYINWLENADKTDKDIKAAIKLLKADSAPVKEEKQPPVKKASAAQVKNINKLLVDYAELNGSGDKDALDRLEKWALGQVKVLKFENSTEVNAKTLITTLENRITKIKGDLE